MTGKIFTALAKIEAEKHWSRGRLQEAMDLYNKLLSLSPNMTMNARAAIESRIQLLGRELERAKAAKKGQAIESSIAKLRAAMAEDESVVELRRSVKKFYRQGQNADCLDSLKQLIRQNAADEFCIDAVVACLVRLYTVEEIPVAVDLFLVECFQSAEKAAQFKFLLADKMSRKGYCRHAEALHRHDDRFSSSTL